MKTMEAPVFVANGEIVNANLIMESPTFSMSEAAQMLWCGSGGYHSAVPISRSRFSNANGIIEIVEIVAVRGDSLGALAVGTRRHRIDEEGQAWNEYSTPETKYK